MKKAKLRSKHSSFLDFDLTKALSKLLSNIEDAVDSDDHTVAKVVMLTTRIIGVLFFSGSYSTGTNAYCSWVDSPWIIDGDLARQHKIRRTPCSSQNRKGPWNRLYSNGHSNSFLLLGTCWRTPFGDG